MLIVNHRINYEFVNASRGFKSLSSSLFKGHTEYFYFKNPNSWYKVMINVDEKLDDEF